MAIGVSLIICVVWTLIAPEKNANIYDAYKTIQLEDCTEFDDPNVDDPMAMNRALKVCAHNQYMSSTSSICHIVLEELLFASYCMRSHRVRQHLNTRELLCFSFVLLGH